MSIVRLLFLLLLQVSISIHSAFAGETGSPVSISGSYFSENHVKNEHQISHSLIAEESAVELSEIKLDSLSRETLDSILTFDTLRQRVGIEREIVQTQEMYDSASDISWQPHGSGGHTTSYSFSSPGAAALRLAIQVKSLSGSAEMRFFNVQPQASRNVILIKGQDVQNLINLNRQSEPDNPNTSIYWSPIIEGDVIGLEIYLPENVNTNEIDITFPTLSHLAVSPVKTSQKDEDLQMVGSSSSCQNDAACYPNWQNMRKATAKMVFTEDGSSYICSGTLLNDKDPSTNIPYFISAAHCIGSQTVASTLQTYWYYESTSSNGSTRHPSYAGRYSGAQLLWTKEMTPYPSNSSVDTSFFRLNDSPPSGSFFAGWSTELSSGSMADIHHPSGDWKNISFGDSSGLYSCRFRSSTGLDCYADSYGNFLGIDWSGGGVEGGSGGSGIYNNTDQLIGILSGGGIGEPEDAMSYYSTFNAAYTEGDLGTWLYRLPPSPSPETAALTSINSLLLNNQAEQCLDTISIDSTSAGVWTWQCVSIHSYRSHAKYYTFSLASAATVQIELSSSSYTRLHLLNGQGTFGTVMESDYGHGNAIIVRTLEAGDYTIEATHSYTATAGSFDLSVNLVNQEAECVGTISIDSTSAGVWTSQCVSIHRNGSYAKYYTFSLASAATVQIELSSSSYTRLHLLNGQGTFGTVIESDFGHGKRGNSRIVRTLEAGDYTIEATHFDTATTGSFDLSVNLVNQEAECLDTISIDSTSAGVWTSQCVSIHSNGSYAKYYTFSVASTETVQIDLTSSSADTWLYLLNGHGTSGKVIERDDDGGVWKNSKIVRTLEAGDYTIEATHDYAATTSSFDLSVNLLNQEAECVDTISIDSTSAGVWTSQCVSVSHNGSYAKYYTFSVASTETVQIDLTSSSADTWLYLLNGHGTSGREIDGDNNGGVWKNSRIVRTLEAGDYTIEATHNYAATTGSFDLSVNLVNQEAECVDTISIGSTSAGVWTSQCVSIHSNGSYAKYYTFSVASTKTVQIDLTSSSADTYLYLLYEHGTSGRVITGDDDGGEGYNSRITRTIGAGYYTIEATTFDTYSTGSFDLSISQE